jgi:DUF4097 and DUF4098 domain-containing protein YvlB
MKRAALVLASALVLPAGLLAQGTVDQRRPASPTGEVEIENMAGTITVVGWDKAEVWVKGTLAPDADLDLDGTETGRISVQVEVEGNPLGAHSDIEVHVPAGSSVAIEGFQAEIRVSGVSGVVEAETVNGSISLSGNASEVSLQSVNGAIDVTGPKGRLQVEVVNGGVTIKDASGDLEASTVNGEVHILGGSYERATLESVAGGVRFEAGLSPQARLEIETVSGAATVALAAGVKADFSVSTFSGGIENELGPEAVEMSRYTPEKELHFSTGAGGARISIQTLSGSIYIRKRS